METVALRELGIAPADFWALTPNEFFARCHYESERRREEWERAAWTAAQIMNVWTKKPITPEKLLGPAWPRREREVKVIDPGAKRAAAMRRLEERWERGRDADADR